MLAFTTEAKRFRWINLLWISIIVSSRYLLISILVLWPSLVLASGWNDFERDIGHGFKIWKTDSFHVCLSFEKYSAIVCGDRNIGDYGPITGYAFTDQYLLIRTSGAKPSENSGINFTADGSRELFFIVQKRISNPYRYLPIGPLKRNAFRANPAVPVQVKWQLPTRFESDSRQGSMFSHPVNNILIIIAWLLIFGPILIISITLLFFAWCTYRWFRRNGSR